jgi:hypothetical protein
VVPQIHALIFRSFEKIVEGIIYRSTPEQRQAVVDRGMVGSCYDYASPRGENASHFEKHPPRRIRVVFDNVLVCNKVEGFIVKRQLITAHVAHPVIYAIFPEYPPAILGKFGVV